MTSIQTEKTDYSTHTHLQTDQCQVLEGLACTLQYETQSNVYNITRTWTLVQTWVQSWSSVNRNYKATVSLSGEYFSHEALVSYAK